MTQAQDTNPISICEITKDRKIWKGQEVLITGYVRPEGLSGWSLVDAKSECSVPLAGSDTNPEPPAKGQEDVADKVMEAQNKSIEAGRRTFAASVQLKARLSYISDANFVLAEVVEWNDAEIVQLK